MGYCVWGEWFACEKTKSALKTKWQPKRGDRCAACVVSFWYALALIIYLQRAKGMNNVRSARNVVDVVAQGNE
jgi:hypothetical protein